MKFTVGWSWSWRKGRVIKDHALLRCVCCLEMDGWLPTQRRKSGVIERTVVHTILKQSLQKKLSLWPDGILLSGVLKAFPWWWVESPTNQEKDSTDWLWKLLSTSLIASQFSSTNSVVRNGKLLYDSCQSKKEIVLINCFTCYEWKSNTSIWLNHERFNRNIFSPLVLMKRIQKHDQY